jgi:hypothetical protein
MYKTILVLSLGTETVNDPNHIGALVVQENTLQTEYRILVNGGMLPNGEDEHYCQNILDAMAYVGEFVKAHGHILIEG